MTTVHHGIIRPLGATLALLVGVTLLGTSPAGAAPSYDDGDGNGCVSCHPGFQGGNGALHNQHRNAFGIGNNCNTCHPSGGGSTPVLTYSSNGGAGLGCAGCHGHDYGETSPNSGQPKATAYGLRQFHVNAGELSCGTGGCHQPGFLGHPNPFPPLFGENFPPPNYATLLTNLTDPCSSVQEDLATDVDTVGLDNDGDGDVDAADPDCPPTTTSTSTTSSTSTTLPFDCAAAPVGGCVAPTKGVLTVNEQITGKEKVTVSLKKLTPALTPANFGDPVSGTTDYQVCIYDGGDALVGEYTVERAGDACGDQPCWKLVPDKGYKYTDKATTSHGILKIIGFGGTAGTGKVKVVGKNNAMTLPLGVAAALQGETSATVQVLTSDASCFGVALSEVKTADGTIFKAVGP